MEESTTNDTAQFSQGQRSRCDHHVRRFFNRVKSISPTTKEVIDDLLVVNSKIAGLIEQVPGYGDVDVLTALLAFIAELGMTINWDSLNKSYYWEDFCTESKALADRIPNLKNKISGIFKKADKLHESCEDLFPYIEALVLEEPEKTIPAQPKRNADDITPTQVQLRHSPPVGIKLFWNNYNHDIEMKYQNPDGNFSEGTIKCSTDRIRIRVLRLLMNYTRSLVDSSCVTLEKIDSILEKHIPIEELQKYVVVKGKLSPYEYSLILEAKTLLEQSLMKIVKSSSLLKYQFKSHKAFRDVLKKVKPNRRIKHAKRFISLNFCVNDILFINFWLRQIHNMDGEDKEEDPLPVILQDRSDDTLEIIGDMMNFSSGCFQKLEAIIFLLKKCEWNVLDDSDPANKDNPRVKIALNGIKENLKPLRRYLKKSIKWIKTDKLLQRFFPDMLQMNEFRETRNSNPDTLWNVKDFKGEDAYIWISLTSEHQISFIKQLVTLKNSVDQSKTFVELPLTEKVSVVMKLLESLDKVIGYSRYFIEYGFDRVKYTAALVKRLTKVDQTNAALGNYINKGASELNLLLELADEIQSLQKIIV